MERSAIQHAAVQRGLEEQISALRSDMRQKDFELSHIKVFDGRPASARCMRPCLTGPLLAVSALGAGHGHA